MEFGIQKHQISDFVALQIVTEHEVSMIETAHQVICLKRGYIFNLGSRAISWSSKKKEVMALSSSEVE